MKDETIEDQNELISVIEDVGWFITSLELDQYDYPGGSDSDKTTAEITVTVRREYGDEPDDQNPFRVK